MKKRLCAMFLALVLCISVPVPTAEAASLSELPAFMFSSGAGAWATTLTIRPDGTFEGEYYDTDTGWTNTYHATTRICQFTGKFTDITQIDTYTFSMRVASLETAHPEGETWVEDMIRYVASTPYGLPDVGGEVLLYLPGHDTSTLPEEFLDWYRMPNAISVLPKKLPCFGLYNVSEQLGFTASDEASAEALTHWDLPAASAGGNVIPEDSAEYKALEQFLASYAWWGVDYDAEAHTLSQSQWNVLQSMLSEAYCYTDSSYPGPDREEVWNFNGQKTDPLGKFASYAKVSSDKIDWVLENIFNCSASDIVAMKATLDPEIYTYDGFYYVGIGGIGGGYAVNILDITLSGERYYVTYNLRDVYYSDDWVKHYAVFELKNIDGKNYWSLYYHKKLANGEVPSIPEPTNPTPAAGSFADVSQNDYFFDAVRWGVEQDIVAGTSANKFSPNDTCTKAQVLTFLWRLDGSPEPTVPNPFSNVTARDYFYKPVLWAHEMGLISGTAFDASAPCTRSMAVTYLWELAGHPSAGSSGFTDVSDRADYAQAVAWAVNHGITSGTGNNRFSPEATCTRAQIITFLYRTEYPA